MLNQKVMNYIDPQGKTNKRIVQAPGGASSLSLAWSNQKTDYGPPRHLIKNKNLNGNHEHSYLDLKEKRLYNNQNNKIGYGYKLQNENQAYNYLEGYDQMQKSGHANVKYPNYSLNNNINIPQYDYSNNLSSPYKILSPLSNAYDNPAYSDKYIYDQINALNYGIRNHTKSSKQSTTELNKLDNLPQMQLQMHDKYTNHNYSYNIHNNSLNIQGKFQSNQNDKNNFNRYYSMPQNQSGKYKKREVYNNAQKDYLDIAISQQYKNNQDKIKFYINTNENNKDYSNSRDIKSYNHNQNSPSYEYRPSVKINGHPPTLYMIGNPDYNFWKDDGTGNNGKNTIKTKQKPFINHYNLNSQQKLRFQHPTFQEQIPQRTSIKVHHPPGGKQTLTLG